MEYLTSQHSAPNLRSGFATHAFKIASIAVLSLSLIACGGKRSAIPPHGLDDLHNGSTQINAVLQLVANDDEWLSAVLTHRGNPVVEKFFKAYAGKNMRRLRREHIEITAYIQDLVQKNQQKHIDESNGSYHPESDFISPRIILKDLTDEATVDNLIDRRAIAYDEMSGEEKERRIRAILVPAPSSKRTLLVIKKDGIWYDIDNKTVQRLSDDEADRKTEDFINHVLKDNEKNGYILSANMSA